MKKNWKKIPYFAEKVDFMILVEEAPKKVNKFSSSWNNFQKFIRDSEEEYEKISYFWGKIDIII